MEMQFGFSRLNQDVWMTALLSLQEAAEEVIKCIECFHLSG